MTTAPITSSRTSPHGTCWNSAADACGADRANRPHLGRHTPVLNVLWTPGDDGLPTPSGPYEPYLDTMTWHLLTQLMGTRSTLRLTAPYDTHRILEALYDLPPESGQSPIHRRLHSLHKRRQEALENERSEAEERVLRPYDHDGTPATVADLASGTSHGDPDAPNAALHLAARSRLGTPSIEAVALYQHPRARPHLGPGRHTPGRSHAPPPHPLPRGASPPATRGILLNTVRMPAGWFRGPNALPPTSTWTLDDPGALNTTLFSSSSPTARRSSPTFGTSPTAPTRACRRTTAGSKLR